MEFDKHAKVVDTYATNELKKVPVFAYSHTLRVWGIAQRLAAGKKVDLNIVHDACFMHAIGAKDWIEHSTDLIETSYAIAKKQLRNLGCQDDRIIFVLDGINSCKLGALPSKMESKIVHDAFFLDLISPAGIADMSLAYGHAKAQPSELNALFKVLAARYPNYLFYPESKQMGWENARLLKEFAAGL